MRLIGINFIGHFQTPTRKASVQSTDKSISSSVELKDKAQAEVVVTIRWGVVVTIRHATVGRIVVVATPTVHAVRACRNLTLLNLRYIVLRRYRC